MVGVPSIVRAANHQDAEIYRIKLQANEGISHRIEPGRGVWLQIARGKASVNGEALDIGDGVAIEDAGNLEINTATEVEALLMDFG